MVEGLVAVLRYFFGGEGVRLKWMKLRWELCCRPPSRHRNQNMSRLLPGGGGANGAGNTSNSLVVIDVYKPSHEVTDWLP